MNPKARNSHLLVHQVKDDQGVLRRGGPKPLSLARDPLPDLPDSGLLRANTVSVRNLMRSVHGP